VLKQQVKRYIERFPEDFRSQLQELDKKINSVFKFLLKKIDSLHQNEISYKPRKKIGFK
jgi:hypothetical protein